MSAQMMWVVLPNGIDNGSLKLTIAVSPRLVASVGELGDWTGYVRGFAGAAAPRIEIVATQAGGSIALRVPFAVDTSPVRPEVWAALFPPSTPVTARAFVDRAPMPVMSFDGRSASRAIHAAYAEQVTASGADAVRPSRPPVLTPAAHGLLTDAGRGASYAPTAFALAKPGMTASLGSSAPRMMRALLHDHAALAFTPLNPDVGKSFVDAAVFYNRGNLRSAPALPPPPSAPVSPEFHDVIAQLADNPEVLRALGLIFDGTVSLAALPAWAAGAVSLRFVPPPAPVASWAEPIGPSTKCLLTSHEFRAQADPAKPSYADIDTAMITLDDPKFEIEPLDVDGAMTNLTELGASLSATLDAGQTATTLPAIRSHGFAIVRHDRDRMLADRLARSRVIEDANNSGVGITLYAEDLLRGYRLDVSDDGGATWQSVSRRRGILTVTGAGGVVVSVPLPDGSTREKGAALGGRDEAFIKASAPTIAPGSFDVPESLNVHETLFGWSGWSLAARRSANTVSFQRPDATQRQETMVIAPVPNKAPEDHPFKVEQSVQVEPGSLPRLRYGARYRFRARAVDLAGNSLSWTIASATHASAERAFLRYEPVISPTLVPRRRFTEGESNERMVIRSRPAGEGIARQGADAFAITLNARTSTDAYAPTCERHVAAPKTSQYTAELHGAFDALLRREGTDGAYNAALKEEGTFYSPQVRDTTSRAMVPQPGLALVSSSGVVTAVDGQGGPGVPARRGDAVPPGTYVICNTDQARTPYLPDPIASGVSFLAAAPLTTAAAPPPLLSVARPFAGTWPESQPFRIVLADAGEGPSGPVVTNDGSGPLTIGVPPGAMLQLDYSSTMRPEDVALMTWFTCLGASAPAWMRAQIAAGQNWMITPKRSLTLVHAVPKPVDAPSIVGPVSVARTDPGATRAMVSALVQAHAGSTGHVDLLASWPELDEGTGEWVTHHAVACSTMIFYEPNTPYGTTSTPVFTEHELGDTKARLLTYTPVGTTRYREYFPPAVTDDAANLEKSGMPTDAVIVPATTRPRPPSVLYVLPAFRWEESVSGTVRTRKRVGCGLRIYLDRPWYSSGWGEQLAIVVGDAPSGGVLGADEEDVSHVGADPIWYPIVPARSATFTAPRKLGARDFARGTTVGPVLFADMVAPRQAQLVTLDPEYNVERHLYFVDVELAPTHGYDFVRLVLAAFQPHAAHDLNLSPLVRTDFALLSPDRSASVTTKANGSLAVTVTGPCATNTADDSEPPDDSSNEPCDIIPQTKCKKVKRTTSPWVADPNQVAASGHVVSIQLEAKSGLAPTDPADVENELGWGPLGQPVSTTPTILDATTASVAFSGTVPFFTRQPGVRYRLVIREHELHPSDADTSETTGRVRYGKAPPITPLRARLVYTDVLSIR